MNNTDHRQIISQSHAARLRGVKRQRINELVTKGKFTTPVDQVTGEEVRGAVYLDEIENYKEGARGRPRLARDDWFKIGDTVVWKHEPRGSFGFTIEITATVVKTSKKKIQLHFIGGDNSEHFAWVERENCSASDNEGQDIILTQLETI